MEQNCGAVASVCCFNGVKVAPLAFDRNSTHTRTSYVFDGLTKDNTTVVTCVEATAYVAGSTTAYATAYWPSQAACTFPAPGHRRRALLQRQQRQQQRQHVSRRSALGLGSSSASRRS